MNTASVRFNVAWKTEQDHVAGLTSVFALGNHVYFSVKLTFGMQLTQVQ